MVLARLNKIDWCAVMNNAVERELCRYREKKTERGAPRPNAEEPLPLVAGNRAYKQFCETQVVDSNKPPWE
jgi:hypothetical protein